MSSSPRVLIISTDTIDRRMAGPGIRYWNFARVLASQQPVTLAVPALPSMETPADVRIVAFGEDAGEERSRRQAELVGDFDVVVSQMPPYLHLDDETLDGTHFAIDLYAPWFLEKLEYARLDPGRGIPARADDFEILSRLLAIGDFYVCASERQRDLWIGSLMAAGRLNPSQLSANPELRSLIDVVPMGLPSRRPIPGGDGPRDLFHVIDAGDPILLWNGGIWNWLDPLTAIRAVDILVKRGTPVRLIFMGARSPSFEVAEMEIVEQSRELAAEFGLLDTHVIFNDWVDFESRQNWLMQASMTLSLHHPTLESRFAFRTRLLDNLWCRVPIIATEGDVLSDIVATEGLGVVVPPGNPQAVAAAILEILKGEKSGALRRRIAMVAQRYTWETVTAPLMRYCLEPWKNRSASATDDYVHKLEQLYSETVDYARSLETQIAAKDAALDAAGSEIADDPWTQRLQIWRRKG